MAALATAAIAGTAAAAAYLDAKFHVLHDMTSGSLANHTVEAQKFVAERERQNKMLVYHFLQEHAQNQPSRLFLEFEERSWTYKQFFDDVQRVGNWLMKDLGVERDEMVALNGPNSAEFLLLQFALEGIGASISFINCNLTGTPLVHSAKLCEARYLLTDRSIEHLVSANVEELRQAGTATIWFDEAFLNSLSDNTPLPAFRTEGISPQDVRTLIYTSGTTGLPKGVMLMAGRHLNTARTIAQYLRLTPDDKFYTCLPLYHGAAQGLCTTPTVYAGGSMRLGRKFSHKTFWPEVHRSGANRLQYVGELCRYLTNAPIHPLERSHRLKEAWGNGMRPDVWEVFRQRFKIPVIHELYAATDGMGATFNYNRGEFTRNAIGLRGWLWNRNNGDREVRARINPDTEDIVRDDETGWVVRAGFNEPGEVLHRVEEELKVAAFKGYYKNESASDKRWMRNVFEPNDLWFRSGDVMRQDVDGRVYFVDRLGDTFRWRSENVSTNEVSDVMGTFGQIAECNVYGVQVPHADGRCGCAMIVPQPPATPDNLDLAALARHVTSQLPRYAVPIFLRVAPQLSYTGTFKIQKGQAKREGVNLDLIEQAGSNDRMYWLPPNATSYQPYGKAEWQALQDGKVKL